MEAAKELVGKVCVFRTGSSKVYFGELVKREGQECLVRDARVFYCTEIDSLLQLATYGKGDIDNFRISTSIPEIALTRVMEIIPMSVKAKETLYGATV